MSEDPKKIILGGDPTHHAAQAVENIRPGELLELVGAEADGAEGSLQAHTTTGGFAAPNFAAEAPLKPNAIEESQIEATIEQGDEGQYYAAQPGDIIYAWLCASHGGLGEGTVAAGDFLESYGGTDAGALVDSDSISEAVAVAEEGAVNTSGTDRKRVKVMVI